MLSCACIIHDIVSIPHKSLPHYSRVFKLPVSDTLILSHGVANTIQRLSVGTTLIHAFIADGTFILSSSLHNVSISSFVTVSRTYIRVCMRGIHLLRQYLVLISCVPITTTVRGEKVLYWAQYSPWGGGGGGGGGGGCPVPRAEGFHCTVTLVGCCPPL